MLLPPFRSAADFVIRTISCLATLLAFFGTIDCSCPSDYIQHTNYSNICYSISIYRAIHPDAEEDCDNFNGTLANIYSPVIKDFLINIAKSSQRGEKLHINGTSDDYEVKWRPVLESTWGENPPIPYLYIDRNVPTAQFKTYIDVLHPFVCEYFNRDMTGPGVTLLGGPDNSEGRLEIFYNGRWGPICSSTVADIKNVGAFCTMLGFRPGKVLNTSEFTHGEGHFLRGNVICPEGATSLLHCNVTDTPGSCNRTEEIGLYCKPKDIKLDWPKIYKKKDSPIYSTKTRFDNSLLSRNIGLSISIPILICLALLLCLPEPDRPPQARKSRATQTQMACSSLQTEVKASDVANPVTKTTAVNNDSMNDPTDDTTTSRIVKQASTFVGKRVMMSKQAVGKQRRLPAWKD